MKKLVKPHLDYAVETLHIIIDRTPSDMRQLLDNPVLFDSILMRLHEAGEHLARIREIDPAFYNKHATESWHRLIGLRNIISHGYRQIDASIIWDVLSSRMPEFVKELENRYVSRMRPGGPSTVV